MSAWKKRHFPGPLAPGLQPPNPNTHASPPQEKDPPPVRGRDGMAASPKKIKLDLCVG